jgi:hypothetical protein
MGDYNHMINIILSIISINNSIDNLHIKETKFIIKNKI